MLLVFSASVCFSIKKSTVRTWDYWYYLIILVLPVAWVFGEKSTCLLLVYGRLFQIFGLYSHLQINRAQTMHETISIADDRPRCSRPSHRLCTSPLRRLWQPLLTALCLRAARWRSSPPCHWICPRTSLRDIEGAVAILALPPINLRALAAGAAAHQSHLSRSVTSTASAGNQRQLPAAPASTLCCRCLLRAAAGGSPGSGACRLRQGGASICACAAPRSASARTDIRAKLRGAGELFTLFNLLHLA